jgi:hypothetical protein
LSVSRSITPLAATNVDRNTAAAEIADANLILINIYESRRVESAHTLAGGHVDGADAVRMKGMWEREANVALWILIWTARLRG